jgi:hypothetical protein
MIRLFAESFISFNFRWGSGSWNRWWSRTTGGHAYLRVAQNGPSLSREWVYTGVCWGATNSVNPKNIVFFHFLAKSEPEIALFSGL